MTVESRYEEWCESLYGYNAAAPAKVQGPPRLSTSRRIRRNAVRELARRLHWARGKRGKSFSETIIALSEADNFLRVADDARVGEHELALLYATQG